jgi:hypothetical protein
MAANITAAAGDEYFAHVSGFLVHWQLLSRGFSENGISQFSAKIVISLSFFKLPLPKINN